MSSVSSPFVNNTWTFIIIIFINPYIVVAKCTIMMVEIFYTVKVMGICWSRPR